MLYSTKENIVIVREHSNYSAAPELDMPGITGVYYVQADIGLTDNADTLLLRTVNF